jgi:hypothetical protein
MKIQIAVLLASPIAFTRLHSQQGAPESEKLKFHKWDIGGSLAYWQPAEVLRADLHRRCTATR